MILPGPKPPANEGEFERLLALAAAFSRSQKKALATNALPAYDDIALRAYLLYIDRGRADGRDLEDWLKAERELSSKPADA
jgi:Protein of unknown function (DUF2934)